MTDLQINGALAEVLDLDAIEVRLARIQTAGLEGDLSTLLDHDIPRMIATLRDVHDRERAEYTLTSGGCTPGPLTWLVTHRIAGESLRYPLLGKTPWVRTATATPWQRLSP